MSITRTQTINKHDTFCRKQNKNRMSSDISKYFTENPTISIPDYGLVAYLLNSLVCFTGTISSIAILIPLLYYRVYSTHSMVIISLCIGDFILCFTSLIVILAHIFTNTWETILFSAVSGCMIDAGFVTAATHASGLSFWLISLERYLAICHRWYDHEKWVIGMLACQWIYSIVIGVLVGSDPKNVEIDFSLIACQPNTASRDPIMIFINVTILVLYFICIFSYFFFYFSIFLFYQKRQASSHIDDDRDNLVVKKGLREVYKSLSFNEKRLLTKIFSITSTFLILNSPFLISIFYKTVTQELTGFYTGAFVNSSLVLNSAVNPFLLYGLDASIKQQFNQFYNLSPQSKTLHQESGKQNGSIQIATIKIIR